MKPVSFGQIMGKLAPGKEPGTYTARGNLPGFGDVLYTIQHEPKNDVFLIQASNKNKGTISQTIQLAQQQAATNQTGIELISGATTVSFPAHLQKDMAFTRVISFEDHRLLEENFQSDVIELITPIVDYR